VATIFVSYSQDSETHKQWVLQFCATLRASMAADVILDQVSYDRSLPWNAFMAQSIHRADYVLIICTREFKRKAEDLTGASGAGTETIITLAQYYQNPQKFIPIVRENLENGEPAVPYYLQNWQYYDFRDDAAYKSAMELLAHELLKVPQFVLPEPGSALIRPAPHTVSEHPSFSAERDFTQDVIANNLRLRKDFLDYFFYSADTGAGVFPFIEPMMSKEHPRSGGATRFSSSRALADFISGPDSAWLILGEYGSGKSSYCHHICSSLIDRYSNPDDFLPIYLACRISPDIDYDRLDEWLTRLLHGSYGARPATRYSWDIDAGQLRSYLRTHHTVIILDGCDELTLPPGWTPEAALSALLEFAEELPCKVILTARDVYAVALLEARQRVVPAPFSAVRRWVSAPDRRTLRYAYLSEFDQGQIRSYLAECKLPGLDGMFSRIVDSPKLSELSRKPVFLQFLAESSDLIESDDVGATEIFSQIVEGWCWTSRSADSSISPEELVKFLEELAFLMFVSNRREVPADTFNRVTHHHFKGDGSSQDTGQKLLGRTFLVRTQNETITFSHNTIMEFLVASKLVKELAEFSNANFYVRLLTDAINGFISELLERLDREMPWPRREPQAPGPDDMVLVRADPEYDQLVNDHIASFYIHRNPVTAREYADFLAAKPGMLPPGSETREVLHQLGSRADIDWFVSDIDGYLRSTLQMNWSVTDRRPPDGLENAPVFYVSYYDAWAYARWRGRRLPSYLEWVKAGAWDPASRELHAFPQAGTPEAGVNCNCSHVFGGPSSVLELPEATGHLGCRHMLGNVAEWTSTWSDDRKVYRLIAGGGWSVDLDGCRVDRPNISFPNVRRNFVGFRCVVSVEDA
jgi:Sulfatase-modifying factor enzyme 1/TIR domain/NACHT domain